LALPLRCTWILEKRAAGRVIVHFHNPPANLADRKAIYQFK
jgi:hypothetical protein